MNWSVWRSVVGVLFLVAAIAGRLPAATIVKDGQATAVLVVPETAAAQARSAAQRIQTIISRMSGARLEILAETAATGQRLPIYLGHTKFAAAHGILADDLKPDEIVLIATDQYVIVLGNEGPAGPSRTDVQQGTLFAMVEMLERIGCRWLWPDPTGHVIPNTRSVVLENLHYRHAPRVYERKYRLNTGMADFFPNVVAKFGRKPGGYPLHDWPLYARLGGSRSVKAGHSFGDWYQRFYKSHPDYFATDRDGAHSWLHIPHRPKLCVSNPAVADQVVADAIAAYKKMDHPTHGSYSLTPNDGHGFCLCPNCSAMDNMSGPEESWNITNPQTGKGKMITHVSLTDRYVTFWNRVAERLDPETPGMALGTLAYSVYRHPPLDTKRIHPKIAIGYVGGSYTNENRRRDFLESWRNWSKICGRMFWRPNFMKEGEGFPLVWATRIGQDIKYLVATGMISVEMPNIHHHWGTQGLHYYVIAKMMWDDGLDPSAVIDDYCEKGFGAAAGTTRRYFARLEELTDAFAEYQARTITDDQESRARDEDPDHKGRAASARQLPSAWLVVWSDEALAGLDAILREAAAAADAGSPEAARIAILREGLEFARLEVIVRREIDLLHARQDEYDLLLAVAHVEQWLFSHTESRAVGVVEGAPYWWRGKRDVALIGKSTPTIMGKATHISGDQYLLTVPGFGKTGRFVSIEFSADGSAWSKPEPYRISHEYTAPEGTRTVMARLTFQSPHGTALQRPIQIQLAL